MSELKQYAFIDGTIEAIIDATAKKAISGYQQLLANTLITFRDEIFDGEVVIDGKKDPYKTGQIDMIDCVLCILGYKPFNAETGEEAGIKDD